MRQLGVPLLWACGLSACSAPQRGTASDEVPMQIRAVQFPAHVASEAPIPVRFQVLIGGCTRFTRLETRRTAASVEITVDRNAPDPNAACPTVPDTWTPLSVSVPAEFLFTGKLTVKVNGKSYGKVTVP